MMRFTLQVQMTDECNVACPYCYIKKRPAKLNLDVFKRQYDMLPKLIEKLNIWHLESITDCTKYDVGFFGGEPLLCLDEMIEINNFLKKENKIGSAHVQTNGTLLTEEVVNTLRENHIGWSFSFDGIWQKQIPFVKKQTDTYFDVIDRKIREDDFLKGMTPKCMISPASLDTLIENYYYFLELGIRIPDFTLVRDDVWSDDDIQKFDQNMGKLLDILLELTIKTREIHSVGFIMLYLADTICGTTWKRTFSCFSGINGCAVTPSGVIYPCSRFYSQNHMPYVDTNTGLFYDDNIRIVNTSCDISKWEKCLKCPLYRFCNAGCNFCQMKQHNFCDASPVDSVCRMLKTSYKYAYKYFKECRKNNIDIENAIRHIFQGE